MHIGLACGIFLLTLLAAPLGLAQEQKVRVLEATKAKKTLQINLGELDGVAHDDLAVFLVRPDQASSKTYFVGEAQAVKVYPNSSIWYMRDLRDSMAIERDGELLIMRQGLVTAGTASQKYRRRRLVLQQNKDNPIDHALESAEGKFPAEKIQKSGQYAAGFPLNETKISGDEETLDLLDLYAIKKDNEPLTNDRLEDLESLYIKELQPAPEAQVVEEQRLTDRFGQRTKYHLDRLASGTLTPAQTSKLVKSDDDDPNLNLRRIEPSLYEKFLENRRKKHERHDDIKKWMAQAGPRWSEEFTDEELANFIEEHGLRTEKERQEEASLHLTYHEVHLDLGFSLVDKSSHEDENVNRQTYTLQAGIEYHLSKRYPKLDRFTVDLSGRITYDNLDLADKNGKYSDQSLRFAAFFFPWHLPSALNSNLIFAGGGTRIGRAQIEATRRNIVGAYAVSALPTAHVGWKYRLSSGLGYRVMASWEWMKLTLLDGDVSGTHPDEITFLEQKIELGLLYSF